MLQPQPSPWPSRRLLQSVPNVPGNPNRIPGIPPANPPSGASSGVIILATLLCALICVIGLAAIARCARSRRNMAAATAGGVPSSPSSSAADAGLFGGGGHHGAGAAAGVSVTTTTTTSKGLKKKALKALPKLAYADAVAAAAAARGAAAGDRDGEEGRTEEVLAECAICLTEFGEREDVCVMPQCGHGFHVACVDTWLRSNSSCPSCRRPIVLDDPATPKRCHKCEAIVLEAVVASSSYAAGSSGGGRSRGGGFLP